MVNAAKVAIVGTGAVGSTTAYTVLLSGLVSDIVLIDVDEKKVEGEVMDLNHAMALTSVCAIRKGDYPDCAGAAVVIVTGGANQEPGQSRMDLVSKNVEIMKQIIPKVAKNAPNTIILMATNPVDVLTYVAQQLSGFPAERVIGSGTVLDSARLEFKLGEFFGISSESVDAYVLGEHGDSEVAAWSLAAVAGMRLHDYCNQAKLPYDTQALDGIFEETRTAAADIIERKGCTNFGIAAGLNRILRAILRDESALLTVSTVGDHFGMSQVPFSVPTKIDNKGAHHVVDLLLDEDELLKLKKSGNDIIAVCKELDL